MLFIYNFLVIFWFIMLSITIDPGLIRYKSYNQLQSLNYEYTTI